MRAFVRFGIAATAVSLALAPVQVGAQEAVTPAPSSPDAVGPAQLRDFNLNGTVIRRAEPAPERSEPAAVRQRPSTAADRSAAEPAPSRPAPARQVAEREPQPERQAPAAAAPSRSAEQFRSVAELPPPSPAESLFSQAPMLPGAADTGSSYAPAQALPEDGSGFSPLPWLIALLLVGGAAAYYFRRQRSGLAFAGGAETSQFVAPEPAPQRLQPKPVSAPAPPAAPAGIVTTRLRPALELQFRPDRVLVEADRVVLEFEALVLNSGSGPARDVLVEAAMFNAGPAQDKEIGAFFERPVGQGDRVPMIGPLKSLGFRSAVNMPLEHLRQFQAGERTVFVPLIGFNVLYRSGGGDAQISAGYLVGKDIKGEKLAPFRLDQGPRAFSGLAARELDVRLRKSA